MPRTSCLVPRTSCLVPRTSYPVPRTSYLVPRTFRFILLLGVWLCMDVSVCAQFIIDGRHVPYDSITHTWLASVPQSCFNKDQQLEVTLEKGWQQAVIDEKEVDGLVTFDALSEKSRYHATATDTLNRTIEGDIQFTFLPVVQLMGSFGNDYTSGLFICSHPDSISTDTLAANIKWRGGSTNTADKHKRNYKIKFNEDHQLLGLRNDNNWILDAGQADVFRLRNRIAMDLWNDMATPPYYADKKPEARNGVRGGVVEVFLNNEYRGIYNLSENLDRKQTKIKKVDDETGEIRGCLYKGVSWQSTQGFDSLTIYDNYSGTLHGFEVKYPDLNDCDTTDWQPLVQAFNFAKGSSDEEFMQHVEDYFDLPPMVDYSIFVSVTNAVDNSGKNMYWAVYDKNKGNRLTLSPWDLDATFGQRWGDMMDGSTEEELASPYYKTDVDVMAFFRLYKHNIFEFNDRLNQRYTELRQNGGVLSTDSLIKRFTQYYNDITNSGAAQRETDKWSGDSDLNGETINFEAEYEYICNWITAHMQMIDDNLFPVYYNKEFFELMSIDAPIASQPSHLSYYNTFTLSGQRIKPRTQHLAPGIYIINGKKYIKH